jgi:hypothetical protein
MSKLSYKTHTLTARNCSVRSKSVQRNAIRSWVADTLSSSIRLALVEPLLLLLLLRQTHSRSTPSTLFLRPGSSMIYRIVHKPAIHSLVVKLYSQRQSETMSASSLAVTSFIARTCSQRAIDRPPACTAYTGTS